MEDVLLTAIPGPYSTLDFVKGNKTARGMRAVAAGLDASV
jgi:hypothetical protein